MILEDDNSLETRPFRIQNFDGDAAGDFPETEGQKGALLPTEAGAGFDPIQAELEKEASGAGFATEEPHVEVSSGDTDFASIKFQRENTLLTNAERYADSIRGEAELYVRQLQKEVDALNVEAEQRYEEARQIKEAAEQEANRKTEEAEQRVEEVRSQAYGEGFEQGRQEGMRERYQEAGVYLENLENILAVTSRFREQVDHFMERDGIRLAVLIAKKILHQELKINKKVVWKLLATTLGRMEGHGTFRIWLSQEDYKFVTAARPSLEKFAGEDQTLSFGSRPDIPPGNAMIETDREVIDLSFASQFHHVESLLYQALSEREGNVLNRPSVLKTPGWRPGQTGPEAPPPERQQQEAPPSEAEAQTASGEAPAALSTDPESPPGEGTAAGEPENPPSTVGVEPEGDRSPSEQAAMNSDVQAAAAPADGAPPPSEQPDE